MKYWPRWSARRLIVHAVMSFCLRWWINELLSTLVKYHGLLSTWRLYSIIVYTRLLSTFQVICMHWECLSFCSLLAYFLSTNRLFVYAMTNLSTRCLKKHTPSEYYAINISYASQRPQRTHCNHCKVSNDTRYLLYCWYFGEKNVDFLSTNSRVCKSITKRYFSIKTSLDEALVQYLSIGTDRVSKVCLSPKISGKHFWQIFFEKKSGFQ